jgi:hypothetical protein
MSLLVTIDSNSIPRISFTLLRQQLLDAGAKFDARALTQVPWTWSQPIHSCPLADTNIAISHGAAARASAAEVSAADRDRDDDTDYGDGDLDPSEEEPDEEQPDDEEHEESEDLMPTLHSLKPPVRWSGRFARCWIYPSRTRTPCTLLRSSSSPWSRPRPTRNSTA